jgi:hypothetical protein
MLERMLEVWPLLALGAALGVFFILIRNRKKPEK